MPAYVDALVDENPRAVWDNEKGICMHQRLFRPITRSRSLDLDLEYNRWHRLKPVLKNLFSLVVPDGPLLKNEQLHESVAVCYPSSQEQEEMGVAEDWCKHIHDILHWTRDVRISAFPFCKHLQRFPKINFQYTLMSGRILASWQPKPCCQRPVHQILRTGCLCIDRALRWQPLASSWSDYTFVYLDKKLKPDSDMTVSDILD